METLEQRFTQMFKHEIEDAYDMLKKGKPRDYSGLAERVTETYWKETSGLIWQEGKAELPYVGKFIYGKKPNFELKLDYRGAMDEWRKRGKAPWGLDWIKDLNVKDMHAQIMLASGLFSVEHLKNLNISRDKNFIATDLFLGYTTILAYSICKKEIEVSIGIFKTDGTFEFSENSSRDIRIRKKRWDLAGDIMKKKRL